MVSVTLRTACRTPLPPYRASSSSRSSTASRVPVDAPDGTMARPNAPESSHTSTSTVGLPRESRISRACTVRISDTSGLSLDDEGAKGAQGQRARAKGREGGMRVGHEGLRPAARGLEAVYGGIGRLLLRLVLACRLAQFLRRRGDVENVVHDLKRQ